MMNIWMSTQRWMRWFLFFAAGVLFWGCAHHQPLPRESYQLAYRVEAPAAEAEMTERWAPVLIVYGHAKAHNRIGRPTAQLDRDGRETIRIDPDAPAAFFMQRSFKTPKAEYTNLIYRVHFSGIPYDLVPFNLSAGKNVGLMVVVTLNAENLPVLVTTVHTCGCYNAIVPTRHLPAEALPDGWSGQRINVYGEDLPGWLDYPSDASARLLVHLRPEVHRVMNLEVRDAQVFSGEAYRVVPMAMEPMDALEHLPLEGGTTSFYHSEGVLKGHVKGSVKPLETIFMSLISLDFFVGTDKVYGDAEETGNRFYTSLKPWRRKDSDMWDFAGFLTYWGWRL